MFPNNGNDFGAEYQSHTCIKIKLIAPGAVNLWIYPNQGNSKSFSSHFHLVYETHNDLVVKGLQYSYEVLVQINTCISQ